MKYLDSTKHLHTFDTINCNLLCANFVFIKSKIPVTRGISAREREKKSPRLN